MEPSVRFAFIESRNFTVLHVLASGHNFGGKGGGCVMRVLAGLRRI